MYRISKVISGAISVLIILMLAACNRSTPQLTDTQAAETAMTYFLETYGRAVSFERTEYRSIAEGQSFNFITVLDEADILQLVLDENNAPLADNVSSLDILRHIDSSLLAEAIEQSQLNPCGWNTSTAFSNSDQRFSACLSIVLDNLISRQSADDVFQLLRTLKAAQIDQLIIEIVPPVFLQPKAEYGQGTVKLQLAAKSFDTDVGEESFKEQFNAFADSVFWDKEKFDRKIAEISEFGYENVNFFVSKWADGSTVEITLSCDLGSCLDEESALTALETMDDSYFRIFEKTTRYIACCTN